MPPSHLNIVSYDSSPHSDIEHGSCILYGLPAEKWREARPSKVEDK